jgi:hypothetical protein
VVRRAIRRLLIDVRRHNAPMIARLPARSAARLLALLLASSLALTACSGDDDPGDDPSSEATDAATEEPYLPVPEGVELTAQGEELALGDTATVAYEPRQDVVGVLDITVTRLDAASFDLFVGWELKPETRSTAPYFVHAEVTNVGESDLGGRDVPLYAVDGDNRLIEASTFVSTFRRCPSEAFPKTFKPGDTVKACLVYLAPDKGDLTAVSFRPTEAFTPITWTGELTKPETGNKKKS